MAMCGSGWRLLDLEVDFRADLVGVVEADITRGRRKQGTGNRKQELLGSPIERAAALAPSRFVASPLRHGLARHGPVTG
jgi:hypothetical protein